MQYRARGAASYPPSISTTHPRAVLCRNLSEKVIAAAPMLTAAALRRWGEQQRVKQDGSTFIAALSYYELSDAAKDTACAAYNDDWSA